MTIRDDQLYELLGEQKITEMVAAFYRRVPTDEILGPMYPKGEFAEAERRLRLFLLQRFGGPTTYSDERGHPRLRMRHAPFEVDVHARNRWMKLMGEAIDEVGLAAEIKAVLLPYFANTATFMMNR